MAERKIVKCKGCGADIFFDQGVPWYAKKVPVLIEKVVYDLNVKLEGIVTNDPVVTAKGGGDPRPRIIFEKTSGYVSHFINCPKASSFSRGGNDASGKVG